MNLYSDFCLKNNNILIKIIILLMLVTQGCSIKGTASEHKAVKKYRDM